MEHCVHVCRVFGIVSEIGYRLFRDWWAGVGGQDRTNVGTKIRERDSKMAIAETFSHKRTCMCYGMTASTHKSRHQTHRLMCVVIGEDDKRSPGPRSMYELISPITIVSQLRVATASTRQHHRTRTYWPTDKFRINAMPQWRAKRKDLNHKSYHHHNGHHEIHQPSDPPNLARQLRHENRRNYQGGHLSR